MSAVQTPSQSENPAISNEILKTPGPITTNANPSTDSVDVVQIAPPTAEERIQAREKALKDRALKRIERREQNHQIAEELCQTGDALFENEDYAGASARYIDATNLWPSNADFYVKLTHAYLKCELYADAAHAATRALSFDPKSLDARYQRGVARLEQGLLPAAKIDFETVIAHNPTHADAHTSLGRVLSLLQATRLGAHVVSPPPSDVTPDGEPVDFAFPRYDDDKLQLAEPSDSSDCNHVGNGVPCRFYNHDGCARGAECEFSHAPDEKSVRDDLGKNVCIYHLLDACKFGDLKCIYSHSKDALPTTHGWWNDPEQIKRVKGVMELAEKNAKEQRHLEVLLYRLDSKKRRGKSQGRGKGGSDGAKPKDKEANEKGGKGKIREGKPKANWVAKAKEEGRKEEETQKGSAEQDAKPADEQAKSSSEELTAESKSDQEEVLELKDGFTDYQPNERKE
ncbi:putative zinc finger [Lyophyllum shimeji]|uniref:Zinc finger n=1 Tax=Lyophyllum shimeji TaxID=47721 RepID=A0A9P3PWP4_LYOSH|nr:putative zinc finger [Lyophyllum shimeji]